MSNPPDYQARAEECVSLAQGAKPRRRALLLAMAEAWFMLAELELNDDKIVPIAKGAYLHS